MSNMRICRTIYNQLKAALSSRKVKYPTDIPRKAQISLPRNLNEALTKLRAATIKFHWEKYDDIRAISHFAEVRQRDISLKISNDVHYVTETLREWKKASLCARLLSEPKEINVDSNFTVRFAISSDFESVHVDIFTSKYYKRYSEMSERLFGPFKSKIRGIERRSSEFIGYVPEEPVRLERLDFDVSDSQGELEPAIAPVVVAMQMLGISTRESCEGHLEDASYPRISIHLKDFPKVISLLKDYNNRQKKYFRLSSKGIDGFTLSIMNRIPLHQAHEIIEDFAIFLYKKIDSMFRS